MASPRVGGDWIASEDATQDPALLWQLEKALRAFLTQKAMDQVDVSQGGITGRVHDDGDPCVRGLEHRGRLGDYARKRDPEQIDDVLVGEHFALGDARWRVSRQEKMRLHGRHPLFRAQRLRV